MDTFQHADKLRQEAKQLLCGLLNISPDDRQQIKIVDRFIECIVGSMMLEIAAMQTFAIQTDQPQLSTVKTPQ